jgi:alpha-galactosidase
MATSSMDKNAQMASNETFKNMSIALQNQSREIMQSLARERLDLAKNTAEDKKNEKQEKRDQALVAQEQAMQSMKEKVDEVRNHAGRMSGLTSYDPRQNIRGTDQYGFMANVDVLKSQAFLSQVQQMRGLGALSNKEGAQVANALASINPGLSYAEQEKQFDYIKKKMDQGLDNIRRIKSGEKPVYGEADTESKSSTSTPTSTVTPKRKVYIQGKGLVEQ